MSGRPFLKRFLVIDPLRRAARALLAPATIAALLASNVPVSAAPPAADAVLRAELPNGLRVVIVRDPLAPVVTEEMNYEVGGNDTPPGFPGMAHAQEHMAASRSLGGLSSDQVATITTLLGDDFNADTQQTVTQYYTTTPADYLDVALRVEAARMRDTLDLQSEWLQERGAIEQEVSRDVGNAFFRFYEKALAVLFAGTPYAHDPLGTRPSFQKTTGPMLRSFFDRWYAPNNAILVIAGDVDPSATLADVRKIFGSIPRRPIGAHAKTVLRPVGKTAPIRDFSDFPVPIALYAYRMPGFHNPDFYAADVAGDVLSSPRGDLYALQAEGKALATGFEYQPFPDAGIAYAFIATPPGGNPASALQSVDAVIANYQKNGVPPDLVEAAKRREIAQLQYSRNAIEGLASEWSDALAVQGLQSPEDAAAGYARVTPDDVARALRTYLRRDLAIEGVLTPKPGAAPGGGGGLQVRDTFSPQNAKPVKLPVWAARLDAPPSLPASIVNPSDRILPNGIRLIVQQESVSPTITLRGIVRHDRYLEEPAGKEGVDDVLSGLFSYGTTTYDRVAYQTQLDAIAADVSAGTSFGLSVPSAAFDRGVQLLADDLLHPALPPPAFAIVQQQTAQSLQGELTTPDYLAQRALDSALLPAGDPALREATPKTVGALALDDVKAYHAAVFRPDVTTIVVAGDVTPEKAAEVVTHWFGGWAATGPKPATELPPVPLNGPAYKRIAAPGRTQATVTLAENVAVRRDDTQYSALQLGDAILGGGFYATRFSRDLRQKSGLVYSIGAGVNAGKTRAKYEIEFGSDPSNVGKARGIIDRDLRDLGTTPPTETEMRQAKTQLARDLSLSEASVSAIAQGLANRADAELPLDEPWRRGREMLGLDAAAVRGAFGTYIDPRRFVEIVVGPGS
jgi:zinc protease